MMKNKNYVIILGLILTSASGWGYQERANPESVNSEKTVKNYFIYGDQAVKRFDALMLKKFQITEQPTAESLKNLKNILIERFKKASANNQSFYEKALEYVANAENSEGDKKTINFITAKRIFYTVYVEEPLEFTTKNQAMIFDLKEKLELVTQQVKYFDRLVFRSWISTVPYVTNEELTTPLGEKAKNESSFLTKSKEEMSKMTVEEVADLDIDEENLMFFTNKKYKSKSETTKTKIESWMNNAANAVLKDRDSKIDYDLNKAKKVLFFDAIRTNATSPKLSVKDIFGFDWKLKWGEEVETEPVGSSLYLSVGAKFTQPVYTQGKEDIIVILDGRKEKSDSCEIVSSVEHFKECFLNSVYKFNVNNFISESGILDQNKIEQLSKNFTYKSLLEKVKLEGRVYIKFKEMSLAFTPPKPYMIGGGPVAFSSLGANEDRVTRGLSVFNYWISNIDVKDQNNKSYLLKDYENQGKVSYIEAQRDFGASFGGYIVEGSVKKMRTGKSFLNVRNILGNKKLFFKEKLMFSPKAWGHVTYSDALWMAKKITGITREELEADVATSNWPDFMQKILVWKLVERRNDIAKYFRLPAMENAVPSIEVPLKNDDDIKLAAEKYQLDEKSIADELDRANLRNKDYSDKLLVNGELPECTTTILIYLLEQKWYPAGLVDRIARVYDNLDFPDKCRYGSAPMPSSIILSTKARFNKK